LGKRDTWNNPKGICAMSPDTESIVLAYPGVAKGLVRVDHMTAEKKVHVKAHESEIACLALNRDGSLLATASETATLVRVFKTDNGEKVHEFRRGTLTSQIYSLAFSNDSKYLCCCSASGTVHLWELADDSSKNKTSMWSLGSVVSSYLGSKWSMSEYRGVVGPALCAFGSDSSIVYVITAAGRFLTIKFDLETGESKEIQNHNVLDVL
jgi:WD40 repeat protein